MYTLVIARVYVLAALESEYFSSNKIKNIFYTGVGKINATRVTTELILNIKPDLILNVRTAGCLNPAMLGDIFGVNEVIERDMLAEPLAPRGTVPFSAQKSMLRSSFGTMRCATGDSFVTLRDEWLFQNYVDLVDMELFAIARVCDHYGVPWRSLKFVTDNANESAPEEWEYSLKVASDKIDSSVELALLF